MTLPGYVEKSDRDPRRSLSARVRAEILQGPCAYCGGVATAVDHVIPWARGGRTTVENSAPICDGCNCEKLDFTVEEWQAWRRQTGKPWPPQNNVRTMMSIFEESRLKSGLTEAEALAGLEAYVLRLEASLKKPPPAT